MHICGGDQPDLCVLFNAGTEATPFVLPVPPDGAQWHLKADTARPSPADVLAPGDEAPLDDQQRYRVDARASVILIGR
jgi:glycogen operon protein